MDKRLNKAIGLAIILVGFCSVSAQIVFMREFLIAFYGNELSIGFILSSWLLSVAAGSYLFGVFSKKIAQKISFFSLCLVILSLLLPVSLVLLRLSKVIMHFNTGEIVALFPIAAASFVLLFPVCLFLGFMFSLACSVYKISSETPAGEITGVYVLEAIGSAAAGILTSFFLVRLFDSLEIIICLCILNLIASLFLVFFSKENLRRIVFFISGVFIILFSLFLTFSGAQKVNAYITKFQWKGYKVIDSRNSIYSNITVAARASQLVFFENGIFLFAVPNDTQRAEESVHFALLEHPGPNNVLLIGGGSSGLLDEILKYQVKHIDYLELDPLVVKLSQEYLPGTFKIGLNNKRVSIRNEDARFFVKSSTAKYDCVIIHLGSPLTSQLNRYYTADFFRQLKERLNPGGIVSFSLNSSENYINKDLKNFLRSIYASLSESFMDVKVIPGDEAYFIASDRKDYLTYDYKELLRRLKERNIETKYVREYYLFSKLSSQRIYYIENILKEKKSIKKNYDFSPAGYFYNLIFWTTYFKDSVFTRLLESTSSFGVWFAFFCFVVISCLFWFFRFRKPNFGKGVIVFSVFITGFSAMALQVIILLSFQVLYGYLFYKLGFILSAFMAGLVLGGFVAVKYRVFKDSFSHLKLIQFLVFIYSLCLPLILNFLLEAKSFLVSAAGENVIFILLPAVCGTLTGAQFSCANRAYLKRSSDLAKVGGLIYSFDLLGSCVAAFATAVFLIPVLGFFQTCLLIAGLNLTVLIFFTMSSKAVNFN